ncbi:hypothetical protein KS664_003027 [Clostridium perfringens]|nr:hypothetical protein [Clostridium perfringens]
MTLPREFILKDDKIIMKPVDELINLRDKEILREDIFKLEENSKNFLGMILLK